MIASSSFRHLRAVGFAAFAISGGLVTPTVHADGGFALNRFEPAEKGSEWFSQDSLDLRGATRPAIGIVGDLAMRPIPLYSDPHGFVPSDELSLVTSQAFVHVGASLVLFDRLRVGLDVPILADVTGNNVRRAGVLYNAPSGGGVGDPRFGFDVRLTGTYGDAFRAAVGANFWASLGAKEKFAGDGDGRVRPHLLIAGDLGDFSYAASLGFLLRAQQSTFADRPIGNEAQLGVSIGVHLLDRALLIGPELYAATITSAGSSAFLGHDSTFAEAILGAHLTTGDLRWGAAAGPGLANGLGNPTFRGLLSLEWAPGVDRAPAAPATTPPADRDHDGIVDKDDACVDVAGVASTVASKNGCPAAQDRDGDGVLDAQDACADVAGVATGDPKTNGCPADKDHDGIVDALDACVDVAGVKSDDPKANGCPPDKDHDGIEDAADACVDVAGVKSADPKKNGCPSDRDGDGIVDGDDACPDHAGPKSADPKKNGCPLVRVDAGQVRILEQIKFKTGSAEILPESMPIIDEVAKALKDVPEIKRVRVEGHTDNQGAPAMNKELSRRRAAAVVAALVRAGIDKKRLESAGVGQEKPIDTNDTDAGRANNRRVEFHIVDGPGAESGAMVTIPAKK